MTNLIGLVRHSYALQVVAGSAALITLDQIVFRVFGKKSFYSTLLVGCTVPWALGSRVQWLKFLQLSSVFYAIYKVVQMYFLKREDREKNFVVREGYFDQVYRELIQEFMTNVDAQVVDANVLVRIDQTHKKKFREKWLSEGIFYRTRALYDAALSNLRKDLENMTPEKFPEFADRLLNQDSILRIHRVVRGRLTFINLKPVKANTVQQLADKYHVRKMTLAANPPDWQQYASFFIGRENVLREKYNEAVDLLTPWMKNLDPNHPLHPWVVKEMDQCSLPGDDINNENPFRIYPGPKSPIPGYGGPPPVCLFVPEK